jgi:putative ABC transport system ATP-binding protein
MLKLEHVSKIYRAADVETTALDDLSLNIRLGEFLAIMGPSGCGKSTLLNILGLIDSPTSGEYLLEGTPIGRLRSRARARRRGDDFGFVFQQFNLLQGRTALENVAAPLLYARGRKFWTRTRLAMQMLDRVGLGDRLETMPEKLSGGEQQRVAIARALVRGPRVILADEPTGALDVDTGRAIMDLLDEAATETGAALVTITHDLAIAARADRQFRLSDGVLVPIHLDSPAAVVESAEVPLAGSPAAAASAVGQRGAHELEATA